MGARKKGRKLRPKAESGVGVLGEGATSPTHWLGAGWPHVCREKSKHFLRTFKDSCSVFFKDVR